MAENSAAAARQQTSVVGAQCPLCLAMIPDFALLNSHTCLNISCNICKERFPSAEQLVPHLKIHDKIMKYFCSKCQQYFDNGKTYSEHKMQCRKIFSAKPWANCGPKGRNIAVENTTLNSRSGAINRHDDKTNELSNTTISNSIQENSGPNYPKRKVLSLEDMSNKYVGSKIVFQNVNSKKQTDVSLDNITVESGHLQNASNSKKNKWINYKIKPVEEVFPNITSVKVVNANATLGKQSQPVQTKPTSVKRPPCTLASPNRATARQHLPVKANLTMVNIVTESMPQKPSNNIKTVPELTGNQENPKPVLPDKIKSHSLSPKSVLETPNVIISSDTNKLGIYKWTPLESTSKITDKKGQRKSKTPKTVNPNGVILKGAKCQPHAGQNDDDTVLRMPDDIKQFEMNTSSNETLAQQPIANNIQQYDIATSENSDSAEMKYQIITDAENRMAPIGIPDSRLDADTSLACSNKSLLNLSPTDPQNQEHSDNDEDYSDSHADYGDSHVDCSDSHVDCSKIHVDCSDSNVDNWKQQMNTPDVAAMSSQNVMNYGNATASNVTGLSQQQIATTVAGAFVEENNMVPHVRGSNNQDAMSSDEIKEEIIEDVLELGSTIQQVCKGSTSKPSYLHCELCAQYFCTEAVFNQHSIIHNKLQICTCVICNTQTPSENIQTETVIRNQTLKTHRNDETNIDKCQKDESQIEDLTIGLRNDISPVHGEFSNIREDYSQNQEDVNDVETVAEEASVAFGVPSGDEGARRSEDPLRCEICLKGFSRKQYLTRHLKIHSRFRSKFFLCDICNKQFKFKNSLERHLMMHMNLKPFSCDICSMSFKQKCHLKTHLLVHTKDKPFSCGICSKSFNRKDYLQTHLFIHTKEKPFSCDICSKQFNLKCTLKTHLLIHTKDKPFSCGICRKQFKRKHKLKEHLSNHTRDKPFSCHICWKQFNRKDDLISHLVIHVGLKRFSCDICEKRFNKMYELKRHSIIHTNEKPFSCDVCSNAFNRKEYLKTHLLIHTKHKPFSCDICSKQFNRKDCLKAHLLIHTKYKPFSCDICNEQFHLKHSLRNHVKNIHF